MLAGSAQAVAVAEGPSPRRRVGTTASSVNYRGVLVYRRIKQAGVTALVATGLVVAGVAAPASAASTGGAGGALTNRLDQSFTSAGLTSSYHIFAAGLDWSRPVGLLVYTDGSGGYGLDNPNSTYLLDADGDAGLVAVARKHNLLLLTPEAPAPGCDGTDNCWYDSRNAVGKARWSSDLISRVTSQYDIDLDRVVIGGYSSGAQWTTRFFLPAHGEAHSVDLAVAIAYGGAPATKASFSQEYRRSTVVSFDTGTADEAYTTNSWGARGGYSWYTDAGFVTDATWPSGVGHGRGRQFAAIMDREITQHLPAARASDQKGSSSGGEESREPSSGSESPSPAPAPRPTIPGDDGSSTRSIDDGGVGGTGREYHLSNSFTGAADRVLQYGNRAGRVYVGDWDGDGTDTLAYRIGKTFYIRDANSTGGPTRVINYGRAGDRVYVGDWDGDGTDTFAVRRGKTYHVKNSVTGGDADRVIRYGRSGDDVLVGDWDGDGRDTFTVRRGKTYHVKNAIRGGDADTVLHYGRAGDDVYVGDWDADRADSLTVRRDRTYYVSNSLRGGDAETVLVYGRASDTALVGDWDGDGRDTLGIRR